MERKAIEQRVRRMYDAFAASDIDTYRESFSPDIVWHVPGNNPVSGPYRGIQEYFETMPARMAPLDEWRISPSTVLVNERDLTALVAFRATGLRRGVAVDMGGYHLIRLDAEGQRIVEGWGFADNQDALDEFFRA